MGKQIHKRLPKEFVEEVLEAFNKYYLSEEQACEMLGINRRRLHALRKWWLNCLRKGKHFELWNRPESGFHQFSPEV